jgi:hypothetical protein
LIERHHEQNPFQISIAKEARKEGETRSKIIAVVLKKIISRLNFSYQTFQRNKKKRVRIQREGQQRR